MAEYTVRDGIDEAEEPGTRRVRLICTTKEKMIERKYKVGRRQRDIQSNTLIGNDRNGGIGDSIGDGPISNTTRGDHDRLWESVVRVVATS
jgi:hypothetical protein